MNQPEMAMPAGGDETRQSSSGLQFKLHPLVLINISDHYNRILANASAGPSGAGGGEAAPSTSSELRVMGCLMGCQSGRVVDVSNSFEMRYQTAADGSPDIDEPFLVRKMEQYKQVFKDLEVVGWYATGAGVQAHDMAVHRRVSTINESPVLLLLDPTPDRRRRELPVALFETELHTAPGAAPSGGGDGGGGEPVWTWVSAKCLLETSEAERIGVDQVAKLLPAGKASGSDQLTAHLSGMHSAAKMLAIRIGMVRQLVQGISDGSLPYDHALLRQVSALLSSLPAVESPEFRSEFTVEQADSLLTVLLASVTRGNSAMGELLDKYALAYERPRRGGRASHGPMAAGALAHGML